MIYRLYLKLRSFISNYYFLNFIFFKIYPYIRKNYKEKIINKNSDICIEGYKRSGNTYFISLLEYKNKKKISIASHIHNKFQIQRAIKLNKPIIFLIRDPIMVINSAVNRNEDFDPSQLIKDYIQIYQYAYKKSDLIMFINFKDFTNNKKINNLLKTIQINYPNLFNFKKFDKFDNDKIKNIVIEKDKVYLQKKSQELDHNKLSIPSQKKQNKLLQLENLDKANKIYQSLLEKCLS